jgi:ParB family chromosome partitioning protein
LKCWPEPFDAVVEGRKTFEWRRDDRGYAVGDTLRLRKWDPSRGHGGSYFRDDDAGEIYPDVKVRVVYILRGAFCMPEDFVVMGIERVPHADARKLTERPDLQPLLKGGT